MTDYTREQLMDDSNTITPLWLRLKQLQADMRKAVLNHSGAETEMNDGPRALEDMLHDTGNMGLDIILAGLREHDDALEADHENTERGMLIREFDNRWRRLTGAGE